MWQRFTERARKVVFYAQEEAGRLGDIYVSTEHLLLGLVREEDSVAARILGRLGVRLDQIRAEVERMVVHGDGRLGQDMQLTPRAKKVIDLAYDEAKQLNNNYIGTEHLLIGLIREGEGVAARVFAKLGVDIEVTRAAVKHLQEHKGQKNIDTSMAVSKMADTVVHRGQRIAKSLGNTVTDPFDLLLALISSETGYARRLIDRLNVDVSALLARVPSIEGADATSLPPLSTATVDACRLAEMIARATFKEGRVSSDHLLLALSTGPLRVDMDANGLSYDRLLTGMQTLRDEEG